MYNIAEGSLDRSVMSLPFPISWLRHVATIEEVQYISIPQVAGLVNYVWPHWLTWFKMLYIH